MTEFAHKKPLKAMLYRSGCGTFNQVQGMRLLRLTVGFMVLIWYIAQKLEGKDCLGKDI